MRNPPSTVLILLFLRAVKKARASRIIQYMQSEPLSYGAGATRTALYALHRTRRVERVGYAVYRVRE